MDAIAETAEEKNIRTEYEAICANLNQLASFRFTLIGFYVAAIGLISSASPGRDKFIMMLWISMCFWILELRNRGLHTNMSDRGMQIERDYWGYKGKRAYEPFISHWRKEKPVNDPEAAEPSKLNKDSVKLFVWNAKLPSLASHSLGLDLLFSGVIIYSIVGLLTV
jgi:hypothetical protein